MSEEHLISKAKKGQQEAQTLLYQKYRSIWFAMCLRYSQNKHDAMDALQNALINILSNLHQFNPSKGSFKSWSTKVVVNENLMILRKKNPYLNLNDSQIPEQDNYHENDSDSPFTTEEILKLLQDLPDGYRTVFNLYVMEGYSHQEISEILNISVGTSKSQLSKAKRMLRAKLEVLI